MTRTLYAGHANEQTLVLRTDDGALLTSDQYALIDRVRVLLRPQAGGPTTTIDSGETPAALRWGGDDGERLVISGLPLEDVPDLAPGTYRARVITHAEDDEHGTIRFDYPDLTLVIHAGDPLEGSEP